MVGTSFTAPFTLELSMEEVLLFTAKCAWLTAGLVFWRALTGISTGVLDVG